MADQTFFELLEFSAEFSLSTISLIHLFFAFITAIRSCFLIVDNNDLLFLFGASIHFLKDKLRSYIKGRSISLDLVNQSERCLNSAGHISEAASNNASFNVENDKSCYGVERISETFLLYFNDVCLLFRLLHCIILFVFAFFFLEKYFVVLNLNFNIIAT